MKVGKKEILTVVRVDKEKGMHIYIKVISIYQKNELILHKLARCLSYSSIRIISGPFISNSSMIIPSIY